MQDKEKQQYWDMLLLVRTNKAAQSLCFSLLLCAFQGPLKWHMWSLWQPQWVTGYTVTHFSLAPKDTIHYNPEWKQMWPWTLNTATPRCAGEATLAALRLAERGVLRLCCKLRLEMTPGCIHSSEVLCLQDSYLTWKWNWKTNSCSSMPSVVMPVMPQEPYTKNASRESWSCSLRIGTNIL